MAKRIQVIPIQARYTVDDILDLPSVLSCDEAAEVAGVPARTMRHLCETGKVKASKLGRTWRVNTVALLSSLGVYDEAEACRSVCEERRLLQEAHERYDRAVTAAEVEDRVGSLRLLTGGD
ncbi:MAG: helix-turn-helix domain-containing protein [Coriobacteriaceae bacterium]|uniref:helix-turn-helix domain-containing protein n=1 Tax=Tractidigestivibacter sp. TaxID=2847320 RepID=UPI002A838343|nr:helix-turn-helix domain-containing protein [Tractidigestivibacter sp.]MCI6273912.1 helix-turn-helix domain-containing protein [Coriobacteriaceae bacterium]MCI7439302.1 helix-turn-helix domain-containing protein [Coriobacteriaceae bacterium]MDY4533792.1 helix-turn-helix domain-containing protein [Tractidigestivibacter sp.]